ncbi:portal protein [Vibrio phage vB_VcorM_GR28A]|nr:portal protein [Vibrio phage vB_VcorM_GR28A]
MKTRNKLTEALLGRGGFAELFAPKPTNKEEIKDEEKLLKADQMVEMEVGDADVIITAGGIGSSLDGQVSNGLNLQREMIDEYYGAAETPEVDEAVDIIINEMVSVDDNEDPVTVDLSDAEGLSESTVTKIQDAFKKLTTLMDFNDQAYDRCRDWYVAGRQGFHVVVNPKNTKAGIQKLVKLDPRCLRRVREVNRNMKGNGLQTINRISEYYLYDPNVVVRQEGQLRTDFSTTQNRIKFDEESIVYVDSGRKRLLDAGIVPSYIHKALKTLNSLINVEDATVIYAITRAPEKRAFLLDCGTLPTAAAKSYMQEMMSMFKTKMEFDVKTGKVSGEAQNLGIVQDLWLPRREGAAVTDISTIGGNGNTLSGMMEPVNYHQVKLYRALNIPRGRLEDSSSINIGGSDLAETTREEHRFSLFRNRLQRRYSIIFTELLRRELVLTGVTTERDFREKILPFIKYDWRSDNFIREQQEIATLQDRYNALQTIEPYIGKIVSLETALKDVLKMTDEEIKQEREQIAKEQKEGLYGVPVETVGDEFSDDFEESPVLSSPTQRDGEGSPFRFDGNS